MPGIASGLHVEGHAMRDQFQAGGRIASVIHAGRLSGSAAGLVAVLILLFIGVVFIILSIALRSSAALSSLVQAHGVRREAVILRVDNIAHKSTTTTGSGSRNHTVTSTTYTAEVLVSLADPVGGQARTTINVPRYETNGPADTLTVLVDPNAPGYAELPGSPSTPAVLQTVYLAVGAFLAVVAITGSELIERYWRRSSRRARHAYELP